MAIPVCCEQKEQTADVPQRGFYRNPDELYFDLDKTNKKFSISLPPYKMPDGNILKGGWEEGNEEWMSYPYLIIRQGNNQITIECANIELLMLYIGEIFKHAMQKDFLIMHDKKASVGLLVFKRQEK